MPVAGHLYDNGPRVRPFLLSEASNTRSRDVGIVTVAGTAIKSGTLLSKADTGAGTYAATAGNTGNFTCGTVTVGVAGVPGVYRGVFVAATKFEVEGPNGVVLGVGTTGSAFSGGGLGFTVTAGGTPAVAGDSFTITVAAAGTLKYVPYQAAGAAGPAEAVLYEGTDAITGDVKKVIINADAEVNRFELTGLDAAGEADLLKLGIRVRGISGSLTIDTPAL